MVGMMCCDLDDRCLGLRMVRVEDSEARFGRPGLLGPWTAAVVEMVVFGARLCVSAALAVWGRCNLAGGNVKTSAAAEGLVMVLY
jgi:hypothetical protein